ncbi:MAG: hypothetical protein ACPG6B_10750 [Oceanihabitans sp.]
MSTLLLVLCMVFIFSCTSNPEASIKHINGYWEMDQAILHNGNTKEYNYNNTIDYFEINDSLIGFRKKLNPNFLGTFETSKNTEKTKLIIENDSLNIYYTTPFATWKESVLLATKNQLKIINKNKDLFIYKRYKPLNLNK